MVSSTKFTIGNKISINVDHRMTVVNGIGTKIE
jgi:hypothetical protein